MVTQIVTYLRDGSDTSTIVRRPRCCKTLNRGYAADFGRWCGSNGNADGRGFASFANGAYVRTRGENRGESARALAARAIARADHRFTECLLCPARASTHGRAVLA